MVFGFSKEEREAAKRKRAEEKTFQSIVKRKAEVERRQGYAEGYLKGERKRARDRGYAKATNKGGGMGGLSSALNVLVGDPNTLLGSPGRKKKKSHSSYDDLFAF